MISYQHDLYSVCLCWVCLNSVKEIHGDFFVQGSDFCVIVRQKNLLNRIPGITDDQKRWGNIFSYNRERSPSCFVIFSNEKQLLRWQTHRSLIIWNKTFALVIYSFFVNHFLKFTAVTVVTDLHLTCLHCNGCEMPHSQVYEAGTTGFRKWLYTVHLLFLFWSYLCLMVNWRFALD